MIVFWVLNGLIVFSPITTGFLLLKKHGSSFVNLYIASTSGSPSARPCQIPTLHFFSSKKSSSLKSVFISFNGKPLAQILVFV